MMVCGSENLEKLNLIKLFSNKLLFPVMIEKYGAIIDKDNTSKAELIKNKKIIIDFSKLLTLSIDRVF